jgi:hypothetical protein
MGVAEVDLIARCVADQSSNSGWMHLFTLSGKQGYWITVKVWSGQVSSRQFGLDAIASHSESNAVPCSNPSAMSTSNEQSRLP